MAVKFFGILCTFRVLVPTYRYTSTYLEVRYRYPVQMYSNLPNFKKIVSLEDVGTLGTTTDTYGTGNVPSR
jgi:hypothetical protein